MKGIKFFFAIGILLVIGVVWVRLEKIRIGYLYQSLNRQKKEKLEKYYREKLIYAEMLSPAKIEVKAKRLGLVKPKESQFRYLDNIED